MKDLLLKFHPAIQLFLGNTLFILWRPFNHQVCSTTPSAMNSITLLGLRVILSLCSFSIARGRSRGGFRGGRGGFPFRRH